MGHHKGYRLTTRQDKQSQKKEIHKVKLVKDNDTEIQVSRKEGVTDNMIFRVGYIKSNVYDIQSTDLQTKLRKDMGGTKMNCTGQKGDRGDNLPSYIYY